MKKAYINIKGGLGNQFFQYSFGEYLKKLDSNYEIIYDLNYFNLKSSWNFELDKFKIGNINTITTPFSFHRFNFSKKVIEKESYNFQQIELRNNAFFDGYWQNPKYIADRDTLIEKFSLKNTQCFDKILTPNINIGVHIRRGDYVKNYRHDVIDEDFHIRNVHAINEIIKGDKVFYIFSDDIIYCKEKFKSINYNFKYVENLNSSLLEFELMKKMDHLIISNSSFSWWAAYLSDKINKITICPKKWINDQEKVDLMMDNWSVN